jgi:NAD kinase
MDRLTENKIVLVVRATRLADLKARFATKMQAKFYVSRLGQDFSDYELEDLTYQDAIRHSQAMLGTLARVQTVQRAMLPNFVFGPEDVVVALGQDGLVANTLKYLNGQPLIGVNPDPKRWDGLLLPFRIEDLEKIAREVLGKSRPVKFVTMAKATLNTGLTMYAVNDLFLGPRTHGSARYFIESGGVKESHSSSGVIISTGLGSTGWLKSLINGATAVAALAVPEFTGSTNPPQLPRGKSRTQRVVQTGIQWDTDHLFFTVREPFPTRTTSASLVFGRVSDSHPLAIESQMGENGVIFSDGIESDFLEFNSGARAVIGLAERKGVLVV